MRRRPGPHRPLIDLAARDQDHHRRVGPAGDPPRHSEAVEVGEAHIEQDDIREQLARGSQRGLAVLGLADDVIALALEQAPGARAEARVVVDDQDGAGHSLQIFATEREFPNTANRTPAHGQAHRRYDHGSVCLCRVGCSANATGSPTFARLAFHRSMTTQENHGRSRPSSPRGLDQRRGAEQSAPRPSLWG